MKLKKIQIKSYAHLKDLELDFTYQSGERKGEALDKICFIGQSGTGKTTILNLIADFCNNALSYNNLIKYNKAFFVAEFPGGTIIPIISSSQHSIRLSEEYKPGPKVPNRGPKYEGTISGHKRILLYLTAELITSKPQAFELVNKTKKSEVHGSRVAPELVVKIDQKTGVHVWDYILWEIHDFDTKLSAKGEELIKDGKHSDPVRFKDEMDNWLEKNPNPRADLAEKCINPLLRKLHLELDKSVSIAPVVIKLISENHDVPSEFLSTGTKQLILSSLPIYKLGSPECIICIDEPERSLFPDIQMELIPYYVQMQPTAQFVVATHSPVIAASFKPEERFILYFDKTGDVRIKRGYAPEGDDPNDILKEDFELTHLMNEFGIRMYERYRELKQKALNEKDPIHKTELIKEAVALGDKYNF